MLLDLDEMLNTMVEKQLKISHLEKKITSKVIPVDKLNSSFKKVIANEYDSKLLKDSDYIIAFYENDNQVQDQNNDTEQKDDTETPEFGDDEKTDNETQDDENKEKDDDKQLNEGIKVQDLSKTQILKPKTTSNFSENKPSKKKKTTKAPKIPVRILKKDDEEDEKEEKVDTNGNITDPTESPVADAVGIDEAETEATGDELRSKVSNALKQVFKNQLNESNKIELFDIKSTKENCYFAKITIKTKDDQQK